MKTKRNQKGFTLIELLVVITIIAILASVAVPVYGSIQRKAKLNKSMQQVRGVYIGLASLYGENGQLPQGANSNEVFKEVAEEMGAELPFYVSGSAWHTGDYSNGPDDILDNTSEEDGGGSGGTLEAGENSYAVNINKNAWDSPSYPLIASGFTENVGTYTDDRNERGGVWEGKNCVVIWGDGRGEVGRLDKEFRFMQEKGGKEIDVFGRSNVEMVNPL